MNLPKKKKKKKKKNLMAVHKVSVMDGRRAISGQRAFQKPYIITRPSTERSNSSVNSTSISHMCLRSYLYKHLGLYKQLKYRPTTIYRISASVCGAIPPPL
jgi:hypothetical protein